MLLGLIVGPIISDILSNSCIIKYETKKNEEENLKAQKNILENIENNIISGNYNTSNLDEGKDDIIKLEKITISLSTTENQKNNENKTNLTSINLNGCEELLRKEYNININEKIYIKKIDIEQEGFKIPKIDFDVYSKLSGNNLTKLNLSICKENKIDLSIPIEINEPLDKLNISSGYYNDLCYTTTSNEGTDINMKDRKNDYIKNNKSVCQEECVFSDYNFDTKKAKCSCNVEGVLFSLDNLVINTTKLYKGFVDIKNIANINLLECYDKLFSKDGLLKNVGFYTFIPIIIFHFVSIIIFYKNQFKKINDEVKDINLGIKSWKLIEKEEKLLNKKINKNKNKRHSIKQKNKNLDKNLLLDKKKVKKNSANIKFSPAFLHFLNNKKIHNPPLKKIKVKKTNNNFILNNFNNISNKKTNPNYNKKEQIIEKIKRIMVFNDEELNELKYPLALKYDKRTYCQYYISLLRTRHIIFFTFFNTNDYNSSIIKADLFFINLTIYYTVNVLFFSDSTMHRIYEDQGKFNFIYQLPQITYSNLISSILTLLIKLLALSEGSILSFKENKKPEELKQREDELKKMLKIKFLLFFVLGFIFLVCFWYYISMFCAIYRNTQIHLIKDTLISFGLSLFSPFAIYLIPGAFRIPSLSNTNNKRNCMYTFSKILQLI